jgi:chromatin segregation and condensation protein Rec8/ScpA/Scc1 (kleisin family)
MPSMGVGCPPKCPSVVQPPRNVDHQRQIDDLRRRHDEEVKAREALARVVADLKAQIAWMEVQNLIASAYVQPDDSRFWGG